MELRLAVRRFFCGNDACAKVTFAERFAGLTVPWAQRTDRLRASLEAISLALAGRAGARLAQRLGVRIGYTSLLRLLRALPDPQIGTVPVLGVDDFAFRRGHTYGTILIDMATHRPIDLLPGRDPAPLRAWLQAHPGVEIVCRDRSSSYSETVRTAAPDAVQVADRFHLWANLTGAVEDCILRHRSALTEPILLPEPGSKGEPDPVPEQDRDTDAEPTGKMAERHRARFKVVQDLLAEGHGLRAIARHLSWGRDTVRHYAKAERWQDLVVQQRPKPSKLDPYKPFLHREWEAGRTNATDLFNQIRAQGFSGSYAIVADYLHQYRPHRPVPGPIQKIVPPTVREVTGWFTRRPDHLSEEEQLKVKILLNRSQPLEEVYDLVKSFATMMSELAGHRLPAWITAARASEHPSLRRFANGLHKDLDAVTAGLTLPHSSGAVEGNVNRLKKIKRILYGRANLDLLRKIVLLSD